MEWTALKRYRIQKGLTQEQLAAALGVTNISVSRWENGSRKISPTRIASVAEKTGISPAALRPDLAQLLEKEAAQ